GGFARAIGFDRLCGFPLNDSKAPLGSRIDRHEHVGKGQLGLEPFRRLLNDRRFAGLPRRLETPKTERNTRTSVALDALDVANLRAVRDLMDSRPNHAGWKRTG